MGLPVKWETANFMPPLHRISHGKRVVAPQRCLVYAAVKVLTIFWTIIPFTLMRVQNLLECYTAFLLYNVTLERSNAPM